MIPRVGKGGASFGNTVGYWGSGSNGAESRFRAAPRPRVAVGHCQTNVLGSWINDHRYVDTAPDLPWPDHTQRLTHHVQSNRQLLNLYSRKKVAGAVSSGKKSIDCPR